MWCWLSMPPHFLLPKSSQPQPAHWEIFDLFTNNCSFLPVIWPRANRYNPWLRRARPASQLVLVFAGSSGAPGEVQWELSKASRSVFSLSNLPKEVRCVPLSPRRGPVLGKTWAKRRAYLVNDFTLFLITEVIQRLCEAFWKMKVWTLKLPISNTEDASTFFAIHLVVIYEMISHLKSKPGLGVQWFELFLDQSVKAPITLLKTTLCCWDMATKTSDPVSLINLLEAQFHIKLML